MYKGEFLKAAKVHEKGDGLEIITQNSYGYGDIIRLAAYATKIQKLTEKHTSVRYLVTNDNSSMAENISKVLKHYDLDISVIVETGPLERYKHNYTNLLKKEYAAHVRESLGCPKLKTKEKPSVKNYFAVWHPYNNLTDVAYDKMPVDKDEFLDSLTAFNSVEFVDYRMDIDHVFSIIRGAKACIGYEGLGQQISYHYNKKIVTLSNLNDVSINTGGPESFITNKVDNLRGIINDWNFL